MSALHDRERQLQIGPAAALFANSGTKQGQLAERLIVIDSMVFRQRFRATQTRKAACFGSSIGSPGEAKLFIPH